MINRSLESLCQQYDAFLIDAYGVFWASNEVGVYPGAAAAMEYLVSQGKYVGIVSNSSVLAAKEKEKLQKRGLHEGQHYHSFLTSGEATRRLLITNSLPFPTPRQTYFLTSAPHPRFQSQLLLFEGTAYRQTHDLNEADFIYISIPHIDGQDQKDPELFRDMVHSLGTKLPVLCVNPDHFAFEGAPPSPVVRQGSIARLFSERESPVYLMGKPSATIFEVAMPSHIAKDKTLMIGDTPETDIRGAHAAGIAAALITHTGIMASSFQKDGTHGVIEKLAASDRPEYLLERFALV